jgi:enoyl-CoA hydratase
MSADVGVELRGRVAVVTLQREPVNALTVETYREITEQFRSLSVRDDVSVVVLRSGLSHFSAGADIKDLEEHLLAGDADYDRARQVAARELFDSILNCALPVIACISGSALGAGAVMAACCDLRVASASARIGLTEVNVGRCGGGRHLSRILPQGWVRKMYFTGVPLEAVEAHRLGAIEELAPAGTEFERALELASSIASKSPLALRLGKEALNRSESMTIDDGYAVEQEYTLRLGASADAIEAAAAFREKREPAWAGLG